MKIGKFEIPPKTKKDDFETRENKNISWLDSYIPKEERFKVPKTTYPRPFIIQMKGDQYGILKENKLYLTKREDFEEVRHSFYGYNWLVGEMDNREANGNHYDPIHVDYIRETLRKIDKIFNNSEIISLDLISKKELKDNPEELYNKLQGVLVLLEESNRNKIEDFLI